MVVRLRTARASRSLAALRRFYVDGLGLVVRAEWQDHEGYDGLVLGAPGEDAWEVEFVAERDRVAPPPDREQLLVLYVADEAQVHAACERLGALGVRPIVPANPYWRRCGATFADPDGGEVVVALPAPALLRRVPEADAR